MSVSTPIRTVPALAVACLIVGIAASANAQVSPKFALDDFEDMNIQDDMPFSWEPFGSETLDASSGDLVITPGNPSSSFASVVGYSYDDVSIRTGIRVLGDRFVDTGVGARGTGTSSYIGSISGDWPSARNSLVIYGFFGGGPEISMRAPTTLDPTQYDVMLQFDVIGDNLTLTAWADGTPSQSISATDTRNPAGQYLLPTTTVLVCSFLGVTSGCLVCSASLRPSRSRHPTHLPRSDSFLSSRSR